MNAGQLRAAVMAHQPDEGSLQWYVDEHVIDCDAGEFWAVIECALAGEADLLRQAEKALWNCVKAAFTVKPTLDKPYEDAPQWTPYTRWVERPAHAAHDLAMTIRRHLRDTGRQP